MTKKLILGAVAGDICGSSYEWKRPKTKDIDIFDRDNRYTDDTCMTVANMEWLLSDDHSKKNLIEIMHRIGRVNMDRGFGHMFRVWLREKRTESYNSYGNGSAMRVSPIGWAFDNIDDVLKYAKISAEVTHDHPEGIKGAQSVAAAIFFARNGKSKDEIKTYIESNFDYNLSRKLDDIRPKYKFNSSCQKSVPESIIAFLESTDYEDCIRNAISLGGDTDTQAAIAGSIAEAFYGDINNNEIVKFALRKLSDDFFEIVNKFSKKYGIDE